MSMTLRVDPTDVGLSGSSLVEQTANMQWNSERSDQMSMTATGDVDMNASMDWDDGLAIMATFEDNFTADLGLHDDVFTFSSANDYFDANTTMNFGIEDYCESFEFVPFEAAIVPTVSPTIFRERYEIVLTGKYGCRESLLQQNNLVILPHKGLEECQMECDVHDKCVGFLITSERCLLHSRASECTLYGEGNAASYVKSSSTRITTAPTSKQPSTKQPTIRLPTTAPTSTPRPAGEYKKTTPATWKCKENVPSTPHLQATRVATIEQCKTLCDAQSSCFGFNFKNEATTPAFSNNCKLYAKKCVRTTSSAWGWSFYQRTGNMLMCYEITKKTQCTATNNRNRCVWAGNACVKREPTAFPTAKPTKAPTEFSCAVLKKRRSATQRRIVQSAFGLAMLALSVRRQRFRLQNQRNRQQNSLARPLRKKCFATQRKIGQSAFGLAILA